MGPTLNLLRDGVTEACALLRACGAAELIDQDQRVLRGVLDDVVDVGALDGEGRALVEHVVAAEEREDLIRHPERRKLCGNLGNPVRTEPKPKFGAQKLPQYLYIRCVRSGWRGSGKAPRDGKSDSPVDPLLTNSPITRVRGVCVYVVFLELKGTSCASLVRTNKTIGNRTLDTQATVVKTSDHHRTPHG